MIISPIFYMGNKKKLIQKGLIELFPQNIGTFIEPFGGSGVVSMNTRAKKYVLNDYDSNLYKFYEMFILESPNEIIKHILKNIEEFDMLRVGIKQNTEHSEKYKNNYIKLRNKANTTKEVKDLYSCIFYAFSQQMRFNGSGGFNMPFGNGAFTEQNEEYIHNGCEFFKNTNLEIHNKSFMDLDYSNADFVYLDPPYLNTTATYNENEGWTMNNELELFKLCEELSEKGIRFGMSNVFENKGVINQHIIDWCDKNGFKVYTFDKHTYMACGKGNANSKEVYICNY